MWSANLFSSPGRSVVEISTQGLSRAAWLAARPALGQVIEWSTDVLLAYGVSEPSGPAREHHREQVAWLLDGIASNGSVAHLVGGRPRHPSRWQRWTSRTHPDLEFVDALRLELGTPSYCPRLNPLDAPEGTFIHGDERNATGFVL